VFPGRHGRRGYRQRQRPEAEQARRHRAWTFRAENQFLPANLRSNDDPNAPGDLTTEIGAFLDAGIDGFFTDNPDIRPRRRRRNSTDP